MKTSSLSVLLIAATGAGFIAGARVAKREGVDAAGAHARKILYYVDPMHPTYRSTTPGRAPDCGMELVAVYDERARKPVDGEGDVGGGIALSPASQQLVGIRVSTAERTTSTERLHLFGRVAAKENDVYRVAVGFEGMIRDIATIATGSRVDKDQVLATLSAPESRTPIQAYLAARDVLARAVKAGEPATSADAADAAVQQTIDRLLTYGMSRSQIEEIGRTREVPSTLTIAARAAGFVVWRNVSLGQRVSRGEELFRIADLRSVWVLADAFGADADHVAPGAVAEISVPGRGRSFTAGVSRETPSQFDAGSQSVKVRFDVDNPEYILRPDMFVDVNLLVSPPPAISVPVDAILDSGFRKTVFVERTAGVFVPRQVETGWRFGGRVQILKGIDAGERVVVAGAFLLDADSRLRTSTSGIGSPR